jgi:hypothetical protein
MNSEMVKFIQAEYGVNVSPLFKDVDILMNAIPQYSRDRAINTLKDITEEATRNSQNPEDVIAQKIYEMNYSGYVRQKRLALLVLLMAKSQKLVSPEKYIEIRKRLGFQETSTELEGMLEKDRVNNRNDFDELL